MTANSIPLSTLIRVTPQVLPVAGNPFAPLGVFFTQDRSIPIGTAKNFANAAAVGTWFGLGSTEYALALIYFKGYTNGTSLPGSIWFMQYNIAAVAGYVRGGSMAGVTLTQLQALSGTLTTVTDGVSSTSLAINLAGATSFSNAAALIQTGIQGGTPSSTATCTYDAQRAAFVITSPTTGSTSTEAFVTGSLAAGLKLTAATGAVISAGAAIQTPAGGVAALVAATQNWLTLSTTWEPNLADKVAFATAVSALGETNAYVMWDTDASPSVGAAPTSAAVETATLDGRVAIWGLADGAVRSDGTVVAANTGAVAKAAWFMGATASINRTETNGSLDYSWQGQAGLIPDVTDATIAANLQGNGYNFYGNYASEAQLFQNFQPGSISGQWNTARPYVNQILMTSDFQSNLATWRQKQKQVPYAQRGYNGIRTTLLDPIKQYLNFGAIVPGVNISQSQRQQIDAAAGVSGAGDTVASQGWYLQVLDAAPSVRASGGSPPINFWYADGGNIRTIAMTSTDVQ